MEKCFWCKLNTFIQLSQKELLFDGCDDCLIAYKDIYGIELLTDITLCKNQVDLVYRLHKLHQINEQGDFTKLLEQCCDDSFSKTIIEKFLETYFLDGVFISGCELCCIGDANCLKCLQEFDFICQNKTDRGISKKCDIPKTDKYLFVASGEVCVICFRPASECFNGNICRECRDSLGCNITLLRKIDELKNVINWYEEKLIEKCRYFIDDIIYREKLDLMEPYSRNIVKDLNGIIETINMVENIIEKKQLNKKLCEFVDGLKDFIERIDQSITNEKYASIIKMVVDDVNINDYDYDIIN